MDGAFVQERIWYGYGVAAIQAGLLYSHYRPTNDGCPLTTPLSISFPALFAPNKNQMSPKTQFGTPVSYGVAVWQAFMDGTEVLPGDYFVANDAQNNPTKQTFFIASMQPLLPIMAVETNETITVERSVTPGQVGLLPYGGERESTMTTLLTDWPVSMLLKGKKEKNPTGLGSDTPQTEMEVLLPFIQGVTPELWPGDFFVAVNRNTRYVAQNVELTDLGYRIRATLVIP